MPTKLNKSGNQQPYIPAGNGDISGEYADSQGDNKHFKAFGKPADDGGISGKPSIPETPKETKPEQIEQPKPSGKTTKELLGDKFQKKGEKSEKLSSEVEESSNKENIKVLNKMLEENEKLTIRWGGSGRNAAGCAWGYSSINLDYADVHTARHELGHTWDSFYGKDLETNKKYPMSDRIVTKYIDEKEGKCFDEVLHDELGIHGYDTVFKGFSIRYQKRGVDKRENKIESVSRVCGIYDELCNNLLDEMVGEKDAYNKYVALREKKKELKGQIENYVKEDAYLKAIATEYENAKDKVSEAEEKYANEQRAKGFYSIYYANSPDVTRARNLRDQIRDRYYTAIDEREKYYADKMNLKLTDKEEKLWKDVENNRYNNVYRKVRGLAGMIGDMQDYMGVSRSKYETNGHGSYYFNQRKDDGFSCEIWANMFDCYMDKDGKQWETAKKMFPKTTGVFERAIKKFGGTK